MIKDVFDVMILKGENYIAIDTLNEDENKTKITLSYEAMGDFITLYNGDENKSYLNSDDFIRDLSIKIESNDMIERLIKNHIKLYEEDMDTLKAVIEFKDIMYKHIRAKDIHASIDLEYRHNVVFDEEMSSEFSVVINLYSKEALDIFVNNINKETLKHLIYWNNEYNEYNKIKDIKEGEIIYENDKNTNN